jgi:hypothetical protein
LWIERKTKKEIWKVEKSAAGASNTTEVNNAALSK